MSRTTLRSTLATAHDKHKSFLCKAALTMYACLYSAVSCTRGKCAAAPEDAAALADANGRSEERFFHLGRTHPLGRGNQQVGLHAAVVCCSPTDRVELQPMSEAPSSCPSGYETPCPSQPSPASRPTRIHVTELFPAMDACHYAVSA
ncbi:uncharacterized protein PAN0_014c4917 [Moesziomyces antarcticus]|uniref:Uncharacterized protein n=2 Tax=Pseudozyma antarctica TaxID=84753 RepID=A0A5C3FTV0_PSEA2|nr:uncharacterized protein PAN0_014c4917 [Moesziomyces antarcticus]GAK66694.1 hypothetical protein PAN0_014c4917 [Moesziomyces antarcticus]SPO47742.1 uncharacterized protein PSANT_05430 [Moesziomyces antarcticus]